ncbi:MAG: hypothetical protein EXQ56_09560 [Acidobacteria bacterium]|nr:hypothetical protein [Acidobacteriota bacterium]
MKRYGAPISRQGTTKEVAEKLSLVVIPSGARNLLLIRPTENKAGSSARQKAPDFGMTTSESFSATCKVVPCAELWRRTIAQDYAMVIREEQ